MILLSWEGLKLKEEDKKNFRHWVRYKRGKQMFIQLLNRFRINRVFCLQNQQSLVSLSELLKIALDEISGAVDTSLALQCMLLSSTFYYNLSGSGTNTKKVFLFEFIRDHNIWQDLDFWERTVI